MSNKTDMQTQLDRQAALIEVLREKAVGGGMAYATGDVAFTAGVKSTGTTLLEVTDLDFKPKFVAFYAASSVSTTNTTYFVLASVFKGVNIDCAIPMRKLNTTTSWIYSSPSYVTTELSENGFTIKSNTSNLYVGSSYKYIAFGEKSGGSSGGGASVDTCTVTISTTLATNLNVQAIVATVCEDGVVSTIARTMGTNGRAPGLTLPITIENVVCGTDFIVQASNIDGGSNTSIMGVTLSGGVVQKDYIYFHSTNTVYTTVKCLFMLIAPTTAGATGTVSIKNQAGK